MASLRFFMSADASTFRSIWLHTVFATKPPKTRTHVFEVHSPVMPTSLSPMMPSLTIMYTKAARAQEVFRQENCTGKEFLSVFSALALSTPTLQVVKTLPPPALPAAADAYPQWCPGWAAHGYCA